MKPNPKKIHAPARREVTRYSWGDTSDIMRTIMSVVNKDELKDQVCEFAKAFEGRTVEEQYQLLQKLWEFARFEIQYKIDPTGYQYIKHPGRLWADGSGDCKSLSIFIYFVCRCAGVPCFLRFASYDPDKEVRHVYPVAVIDGQEVIVDAVYHKFDQEERYTFHLDRRSKVFNQMARIIEVAGISTGASPTPADLQTELKQRAELVKPTAYVDTANMSTGEMRIFLEAQRYKMFAEFFPEDRNFKQQYERRRDALYKGLHTFGLDFAGARMETRPASGWQPWAEKARQSPTKGFGLLFDDTPLGAQVSGVGAIPQLNCDQLYPNLNPADYPGQNWVWVAQENANRAAKRLACQMENKWRAGLNDFWEKSGNTLVYDFITNQFGNSLPILVGEKRTRQKDFLTNIADSSLISRSNLKFWTENGIIYNNAQAGLGPMGAIEFVEGLRDAGAAGINGFPIVLVQVAIGVLKSTFNQFQLFLDVIKGDQNLKQAVQAHVDFIENWFKEYETQLNVLAKPSDWPDNTTGEGDGGETQEENTDGGQSSTKDNKMLLIGGALVVGALLLKD